MRKRLFTLLMTLVLIVTCITPITASAARITQEYAVTNLLRWARFTQADADAEGGWVKLAYSVKLVLETDNFVPNAPCTTAYYNTLRKRANHLFRQNSAFVKIVTQPQSSSVELGTDMILIAEASISDGTETAYQWYSCADANKTAAKAIGGATNETLTVNPKKAGVYYYFCRFSAKTAKNVEPLDSDVVCVTVTKARITVVTQPENLTPDRGSEAVLTVAASASNGIALSYQWYSCVDENKTNATPIAGATEATFSAPTKDFGAVYYFCRLSAEKAETVDTDVIFVDITTALSSFEYTVDADAGTVLLSKYIGTEKTVVVPPFYTVDGTVYATVLDSTTVFYQNTNITDVKLYEGVSFANNTMANLFHGCLYLVNADLSGVNTTGVIDMSSVFEGCTKLTTVDVTGIDTSSVTTMAYLFYDCKALTSLTGYEYWDTSSLQNICGSFNKVSSALASPENTVPWLKILDLSRWDLSKIESSRICFQHCKAEQILLPDNLKTINAFFMNHAEYIQGKTFTIPAGVEKIGYDHVFYNFGTVEFEEFIVADGNKNYKAIDGILYSADGKEMLAIPKGKTFENGVYEIPEGVEFLGMLSFSRNPHIKTVVIPNSLELKFVPSRDPAYTLPGDNGNINPGNNLNIAIYLYTSITDYAVKDNNPHYKSRNGVIYTKDMTSLVAIPTRYDQYLDIPEGVTNITYEASLGDSSVDNLMSKCTGISIPSTLTNISSDQLDKLNRLRANYSKTFTITVSPDNPVYALDATGALVEKTSWSLTQPQVRSSMSASVQKAMQFWI